MPVARRLIVGHSERRQIFGETDEMINKRLKGGLVFGLLMILCIGETLAEREEERTFAVLGRADQKGAGRCECRRYGQGGYCL